MSQIGQPQAEILEVSIAGVSLRLKTSNTGTQLSELVGLVNEKIDEALKKTKSGSLQTAAILASLNLAEELIQLKSQLKAELKNLESQATSILKDISSGEFQTPRL